MDRAMDRPVAATTVPTNGSRSITRQPARQMAAPPERFAQALRSAGGGTRAGLVADLQRLYGNAAVAQLIDQSSAPVHLQRWPVRVAPATTECMVVVDWLNQNSPHRNDSGWAKTRVRFDWTSDGYSYAGTPPDLTVSARNPRVTMTKSVDMPSWSPTAPIMQAAWRRMTADLRAHEARHEQIADDWRPRLQDRFDRLTVSATSRDEGQRAIVAEWRSWLDEHQADQRAIDPFSALLECSAAEEAGTGG